MLTRARATFLIIGGAIAAFASSVRAETNATIRVAIQPAENAMEVYYARDTGRFAAAGLNVDIQTVQSTAAIAAARCV